jgi:hypothetical protein
MVDMARKVVGVGSVGTRAWWRNWCGTADVHAWWDVAHPTSRTSPTGLTGSRTPLPRPVQAVGAHCPAHPLLHNGSLPS